MSVDRPTDGMEQELTAAVLSIPGVRALFPHSKVAAAAATLVGTRSATVEVRVEGVKFSVAARLAVETAATSVEIVTAAETAVRQVLGDEPFMLSIEIAAIV